MSTFIRTSVLTLTIIAAIGAPSMVFAQGGPFVPVVDIRLNPKFDRYLRMFDTFMQDFDDTFGDPLPDGTTDSLRDLISGSDPQGLAAEPCATRDPIDEVYMTEDGPWKWADASTTAAGGFIYRDTELDVKVNKSASLRCLLQELVEWEKLGLNLQIHALLKEYISDAQTKQLSNQLRDQITAANLNWAKRGIEVNNAGVVSTQPVYVTNVNRYLTDRTGREVEDVTDRVASSPTDPEGSYGMCEPFRLRAAQNVAENNRDSAQDPFDSAKSKLECTATNPGNGIVANESDLRTLYQNANDPAGPGVFGVMRNMRQQPQNWSLTGQSMADAQAESQVQSAKRDFNTQFDQGVLGTEECSGVTGDPRCVTANRTVSSPSGARNADTISRMGAQGTEQVSEGNMLDAHATGEAPEDQDNLISSGGLLNYDTEPLASQQTYVNNLIEELQNVIDFSYYDTSWHDDDNAVYSWSGGDDDQEIPFHTREWAIAAMFMIYDQMRFSASNPTTATAQDTSTPSGDPGDTYYFDP
ncbi:MAG TPA: hypothetical protein VLB83_05250 [Candidatus Paceibacterota bacterium]|nr:hypothetical protein [Candidatus Paceibacterota bacterium]